MNKKKSLAFLLVMLMLLALFAGCAKENTGSESQALGYSSVSALESPSSNNASQAKAVIRIGAIKGPSSLGMLGLMDANDKKQANNIYNFTQAGSPADIQAMLINGELDIAAVPVNIAAALYNKTEKKISTIAVSTLGVLYIVANKDEQITSFADLEGKTIYASGQGATPEYVLNYLLEKNGLTGKVTVDYKAEHAEVAALMASGGAAVALLPQPFVTTVTSKDENIQVALDINTEWKKSTGSQLAMTCIVARNSFIENSKAAVDKFLDEYYQSTEYVNANVAEAAQLSEKYDIIPAAVAEKAIPKCAIVFISGKEMKPAVEPVLTALLEANPQSVGGSLPDDAFYYER